jgi:hypothetical protein
MEEAHKKLFDELLHVLAFFSVLLISNRAHAKVKRVNNFNPFASSLA